MGISKSNLFSKNQNKLAQWAHALSHPARVAIIEYLINTQSCINKDLVEETGLAQATISQHLRELKDTGIIKGEIEGTRICYCIDSKVWAQMGKDFELLLNQKMNSKPSC